MKMQYTKLFLAAPFGLALVTAIAAPSAHAASPYTWTQDSAATQTWTTIGNWDANGVDSGPGAITDVLNFFADTTTALAAGNNLITSSVPTLTMNVLTLKGLGASATGASNVTIGTNATTWTLDGTTPTVNLNGLSGTMGLNYTVATNFSLAQATTLFTGNGTAGFDFSGIISGTSAANGITKSGTSKLTLSGANTHTGNTVVTAGTLQIDGSYAVAGGGTTSLLRVGYNSGNNGSVIIGSGAGTVTFGGGGYGGGIVGAGDAAGTGTGSLTINGGTVNFAGTAGTTAASLDIGGTYLPNTNAGTGTVTVNGGSLNVGARILMGFNSGSANGTLTIAGGTVTLGTNKGGSTYGSGTGGNNNPGNILMGIGTTVVNLNSGTLKVYQFQAGTTAATNRTINFNGGTLVALGTPNFFLGNQGSTGSTVTAVSTLFTTRVRAGGAIIDTNNFNITIPTALVEDTGSTGGGLTKLNTGTLTLSGSNTYTGATTINEGTLALGASNVLANTTAVSIGSATLDAATFSDTAGTLQTTGSAVINLGSSAAKLAFAAGSPAWTGTLNITGAFVAGNLGSLRFGTTSSGLSSTQLGLITVNGAGAGTYTLDAGGFLTTAGGYASWQAKNGTTQAADLDHDGDGVSNGIEYFLGGPNGDTTGFTGLPGVDKALDGTLSVTWTMGSGYTGVYGTDFFVETSATLAAGTWTTEIADPNPGFTVTLPSATEVKFTFPAATSNFARLRVIGAP